MNKRDEVVHNRSNSDRRFSKAEADPPISSSSKKFYFTIESKLRNKTGRGFNANFLTENEKMHKKKFVKLSHLTSLMPEVDPDWHKFSLLNPLLTQNIETLFKSEHRTGERMRTRSKESINIMNIEGDQSLSKIFPKPPPSVILVV